MEARPGRRFAAAPGGAVRSTTTLPGSDQLCRAAAFDRAGRLQVAGAFAVLGGLRARGEHDGFVARLNGQSGELAALTLFGGAGNDLPRALLVRADGTTIVGGMFAGDVLVADAVLEVGRSHLSIARRVRCRPLRAARRQAALEPVVGRRGHRRGAGRRARDGWRGHRLRLHAACRRVAARAEAFAGPLERLRGALQPRR